MPDKTGGFTYATVCSGIECMSAAVAPLGGWKPVFFSEIESEPRGHDENQGREDRRGEMEDHEWNRCS